MYVPAHHAMPADEARRVLGLVRLADLVTVDPDTLTPCATPLPLVYDPAAGPLGAFTGHVARTNQQWRHTAHPALVIVRGGDGYVDPQWYPSYRAGGDGVPTWDYETVHATGRLVAHHDSAWLEAHVRALAARHDPGYDLDRSSRRFVEGQLRAVVGVELVVTDVVGKSKLSQNRSVADVEGVIAGFEGAGRPDLADRVREVALPHAAAREGLVEVARQARGPR